MKYLAILCVLLWAATASAQTHPCDLTPPTSGTGVAGQTKTLTACHSGVDTNGNAVNGWKLYDNGGAGVAVTMTKSATASTGGQFEFTAPYTVPATAGVHTLQVTALSGSAESPKSAPFALTVSLPQVAPVAPTKVQVQ